MSARLTRGVAALLAAATLPLAACTPADEADAVAAAEGEEVTNGTLASELADLDGFSFVESTLDDTGLSTAFDGAAAYTVLAPRDAAFESLGDEAALLSQPQNRAIAVALVRDHVLPGALTPDDIRNAVANTEGGEVTMTTLGDSTITFSMNGEDLMASIDGGEPTLLPTSWTRASNGVVIPIDGVLGELPPLQETPANT